MDLLAIVFWVSLVLAVVSFLFFALFAAQRYIEILRAAKALSPPTSGEEEEGVATGLRALSMLTRSSKL
jgi:hypothetical protein